MAVFALPALSVVVSAQPRHGGVFAYRGGDNVEECFYVYRTTRAVPGYRNPQVEGRPVRTVAAGRTIAINDRDMVITVMRSAIPSQVLRAFTLPVSVYGSTSYAGDTTEPGSGSVSLYPGQTIELLHAREVEGSTELLFRFNGIAYSAWLDSRPNALAGYLQPLAFPPHETWLHLTPRAGRPAAWVRVGDYNTTTDCAYMDGTPW